MKTNLFDVNDDQAQIQITINPTLHDHEPDDEMIQKDEFREAVKKRVREDPSLPVKRAYDATSSSVARGGYLRLSRQSLSEFSRIRSCVGRAKREDVPPIPRRLGDVHIDGIWREIWSSDEFLVREDTVLGIVIFATDENIHILQSAQTSI